MKSRRNKNRDLSIHVGFSSEEDLFDLTAGLKIRSTFNLNPFPVRPSIVLYIHFFFNLLQPITQ